MGCISNAADKMKQILQDIKDNLINYRSQMENEHIPQFDKVVIAGTSVGYAGALAMADSMKQIDGLTGEDIEVLTTSGVAFSEDALSDKTLLILMGEDDYSNTAMSKSNNSIQVLSEYANTENPVYQYESLVAKGLILVGVLKHNARAVVEELSMAIGLMINHVDEWVDDAKKIKENMSDGNLNAYETIGAGGDMASAWLARLLIYDNLKKHATVEESENFLHVNMLQVDPKSYGTFIYIGSENEAADRTMRTVDYVDGIGHAAVVFSDISDSKHEFPCYTVRIPHVSKSLMQIMFPVPTALIVDALR